MRRGTDTRLMRGPLLYRSRNNFINPALQVFAFKNVTKNNRTE